jgi:hypothetical protein
MENIPQNNTLVLKTLRLSARIMSIILFVFCLLFAMILNFMLNPAPGSKFAPVKDYFIASSILAYMFGLLLAFKWELLGAIVGISWIISAFIFTLKYITLLMIVLLLVLSIPCFLFILSWILQKGYKDNHQL